MSPQDVDASEIKVQVCVYAFDLLYLNGEVRLKIQKYYPEILQNMFVVCEHTCALKMQTLSSNANDGAAVALQLDNDCNTHCNSSRVWFDCVSV